MIARGACETYSVNNSENDHQLRVRLYFRKYTIWTSIYWFELHYWKLCLQVSKQQAAWLIPRKKRGTRKQNMAVVRVPMPCMWSSSRLMAMNLLWSENMPWHLEQSRPCYLGQVSLSKPQFVLSHLDVHVHCTINRVTPLLVPYTDIQTISVLRLLKSFIWNKIC